MKVKYIFCDLDGTLLTDDKRITETQVQYLKKMKAEKDVRLGFATGRAWMTVQPLIDKYGLADVVDACVINNGAEIYDAHAAKLKRKELLEKEQIEQILEIFKPYDFITVGFHNPKGYFCNRMVPRAAEIMRDNGEDSYYFPWEEEYEPAPRVMLLFDRERRDEVAAILEAHPIDKVRSVFSEPNLCEMMRTEVSKAKGIQDYVSGFGDRLTDVMVFGNSDNDFEMMKSCGVSVAVKNATELVLKNADYVSSRTNNEDGVTTFLREHTDLF